MLTSHENTEKDLKAKINSALPMYQIAVCGVLLGYDYI